MRGRFVVILIGAVATIASGACNGGDERTTTRIQVIDSSFTESWEPMEDTGTVYRIAVVTPHGADTIRNVIPPAPIIIGDTMVIGLVQVSEDSSTPQRQIFRLRLGQHRVETNPIPDDVWGSYQDILFSPDGRYVAYVGEDTTPANPGTYAIVRDLKSGAIVVRGPGGGGCDCDEDLNHARWFPPDSFEIAVAHRNTGGGWQRFSGKASASRVHVDTLSDEPDWH
jgi:dipeptidyl aminopeptidase/acylaminoacyl peptidase